MEVYCYKVLILQSGIISLEVDCDKLKIYTINYKATTKIIQQTEL